MTDRFDEFREQATRLREAGFMFKHAGSLMVGGQIEVVVTKPDDGDWYAVYAGTVEKPGLEAFVDGVIDHVPEFVD